MSNERGSSLLEVSVTLFFLGFAFIPLINLFHVGEVSVLAARQELGALNQAQEAIEQIKAVPDICFGVVQGAAEGIIHLEDKAAACCDQGLLALTDGPGSGQVRGITGWEESDVLLDHPWDVSPEPKATSYLVLPLSNQTYPFTVTVTAGRQPGLRTIAVTVSCQEKEIIRNVTLVTEKLRR